MKQQALSGAWNNRPSLACPTLSCALYVSCDGYPAQKHCRRKLTWRKQVNCFNRCNNSKPLGSVSDVEPVRNSVMQKYSRIKTSHVDSIFAILALKCSDNCLNWRNVSTVPILGLITDEHVSIGSLFSSIFACSCRNVDQVFCSVWVTLNKFNCICSSN